MNDYQKPIKKEERKKKGNLPNPLPSFFSAKV